VFKGTYFNIKVWCLKSEVQCLNCGEWINLTPKPVDSWLEYTGLAESGQAKLSGQTFRKEEPRKRVISSTYEYSVGAKFDN
jgi:hypothetical protein